MEEGGAPASTFQEWAASLLRPGKYVDGLVLQAMARGTQRSILLVDSAFAPGEALYAFGAGERPEIVLVHQGGHYLL
eukprot:108902-Alexandrium_andersonii.AAC.1